MISGFLHAGGLFSDETPAVLVLVSLVDALEDVGVLVQQRGGLVARRLAAAEVQDSVLRLLLFAVLRQELGEQAREVGAAVAATAAAASARIGAAAAFVAGGVAIHLGVLRRRVRVGFGSGR